MNLTQELKTKHLQLSIDMKKFPFEHVVNNSKKEVWVKCNSSITAMGLKQLVNEFYPGYTPKIGTDDYLNKMRQTV